MKINIIFRTCDVVDSVHGTERPFNLSKSDLITICFKSLINSLGRNIEYDFYIIGDRLSNERIEFFRPNITKLYNSDSRWGNSQSIVRAFELAKTLPDEEWIYFCEDDYLHLPNALTYLHDFLINYQIYLKDMSNKDLFIHPVDYPDRYSRSEDFYEKWHIILSKYCHWRQIYNTTYTFFCSVGVFKKYFNIFMESASNWNDGLFSEKVYKRDDVICLSPMPTLACHMHSISMSPFVDWKKLIYNLK